MRVSGGRFFRSSLAVNPVRVTASGPMARVGFLKESVVSQSTIMRAPRSVADQTMAESGVTSPDATPEVMAGRWTPMLKGWKEEHPKFAEAQSAAAEVVRKLRREGLGMSGS